MRTLNGPLGDEEFTPLLRILHLGCALYLIENVQKAAKSL